MEAMMTILYAYLLIINLIGFILMGWDKYKAKKRQRRVPETRLFLIAAIGGSLGSWMGMSAFRHKTKHRSFTLGIPALFIFNLFALIFTQLYLIE
jgi:uncharacterized membrane protein YsdA (DUF1294 family)